MHVEGAAQCAGGPHAASFVKCVPFWKVSICRVKNLYVFYLEPRLVKDVLELSRRQLKGGLHKAFLIWGFLSVKDGVVFLS